MEDGEIMNSDDRISLGNFVFQTYRDSRKVSFNFVTLIDKFFKPGIGKFPFFIKNNFPFV